MVYNDRLVVYCSDQRDPAYGQMIVHQTSSDAVKWGAVVNDVAMPTYSDRPGMPVISKMGNGNYFMSFKYCGAPEAYCAVYAKIGPYPLNSNSVQAGRVITNDGSIPASSPYTVYSPNTNGGSTGAVILNSYASEDIYANRHNCFGTWTRAKTNLSGGYSWSLAVGLNPKDVHILNGDGLSPGSSRKIITTGATDINGCTYCS